MATGKDASRIGAESRWREGIFLGLFGAGQDANDYAVGTPDGVEAARAIKLEPDESAWDVELLLSVKGATMGPQAARPDDQGQNAENIAASRSSPANRASTRRRWRARRSFWPTTGVH